MQFGLMLHQSVQGWVESYCVVGADLDSTGIFGKERAQSLFWCSGLPLAALYRAVSRACISKRLCGGLPGPCEREGTGITRRGVCGQDDEQLQSDGAAARPPARLVGLVGANRQPWTTDGSAPSALEGEDDRRRRRVSVAAAWSRSEIASREVRPAQASGRHACWHHL